MGWQVQVGILVDKLTCYVILFMSFRRCPLTVMDAYLQMQHYNHLLQHIGCMERVFRDMENPFDDVDFIFRFEFTIGTALYIIERPTEYLTSGYGRMTDIRVPLQVLTALRFFTTGSLQRVTCDLTKVSVSSVCRMIRKVRSNSIQCLF